jgi:hypothetical protein
MQPETTIWGILLSIGLELATATETGAFIVIIAGVTYLVWKRWFRPQSK